MKRAIYLLFISLPFVFTSCKKSDPLPPTLGLSSTTIDIGNITSSSTSSLTLTKSGEGTISYTVSSNKSWLTVDKTSGNVLTTDIINLKTIVPSNDLVAGANSATLTITPTINGTVSTPVTVTVNGSYKVTGFSVSSTAIDLGTIKENAISTLTLTKVGTENLTFDASSDKNWIILDKTSGSITSTETIKVTIDTKNMVSGSQDGKITLTPKVNGVASTPIVVTVKANYDDSVTGAIEKHTLTKNETWYGTINLNGDVTVPKGYTLTIKPGTKILVKNIPDNEVLLEVNGKLIMNGTATSIIEMKSAATNPESTDWLGIEANGDIEVSYAVIRDAYNALDFLFSGFAGTPTKAPVIHHCLFENNFDAIKYLSSDFETTLNNLTFRNMAFASIIIADVKKLNLNDIDFLNTNGDDISIFGDTENITIKNSNFTNKKYSFYYHVYVHDNTKYKDNKVEAISCFNLTAQDGFTQYNNTFVNTTPVSAQIPNIGCGFTNLYSGGRMKVSNKNTFTSKQMMTTQRNLVRQKLAKERK